MEGAKKTKLKKLEVNSVDLVPAGANPDAHINLFKSKEERPAWNRFVGLVKKSLGMDEADIEAVYAEHFCPVNKQRIENEIWDYTSALRDSFSSIMKDAELNSEDRCEMLQKSMDEFTTAMNEVIPLWSTGQEALQKSLDDDAIELYKQLEIEALEERLAVLKAEDEEEFEEPEEEELEEDNFEEPEEDEDEEFEDEPEEREENKDMKINKSLLNAEEQAQLEAIIAKAAMGDTPEFDELKKMNDEVAELKKALAMKDMETVAKGYEILGKDTEELTKSLYAMKQAGQEVYDEYVRALDIAKSERENSGMFTEIGKSNTEGDGSTVQARINAAAAEIMKADPSLNAVTALAKAWEQNPALVKEYEEEVM